MRPWEFSFIGSLRHGFKDLDIQYVLLRLPSRLLPDGLPSPPGCTLLQHQCLPMSVTQCLFLMQKKVL